MPVPERDEYHCIRLPFVWTGGSLHCGWMDLLAQTSCTKRSL